MSFGGISGTNVTPTVDGADNRDNHYGGPLMSFTTESLEQFQLATSQFTAADGRTGGAAITMVTKSGTNVFHGSGFVYERDKTLTAKDYFTKQANADKVAVQPPAVRRIDRRSDPPEPDVLLRRGRADARGHGHVPCRTASYDQFELLVDRDERRADAGGAGQSEPSAFGPQPGSLRMYIAQGERCSSTTITR